MMFAKLFRKLSFIMMVMMSSTSVLATEAFKTTRNDITQIPVIHVWDSDNDGNVGSSVNDGDLDTRWSSKINLPEIVLSLDSPSSISMLMVAAFEGDIRVAYFDVQVSEDGLQWTPVGSFETSGQTVDLEIYPIDSHAVSYVKITGKGNSRNNWNSFTEVEVWGAPRIDPVTDTESGTGKFSSDDTKPVPCANPDIKSAQGGECFIVSAARVLK